MALRQHCNQHHKREELEKTKAELDTTKANLTQTKRDRRKFLDEKDKFKEQFEEEKGWLAATNKTLKFDDGTRTVAPGSLLKPTDEADKYA